MEEYIVQHGDTFKTIAKEQLGDETRWFEVAQLNGIESPYQLYIGGRINLPNKISAYKIPPPMIDVELQPAIITPARGFMYVVFEQLPEVGSKNVLRKVQVIPTDFSLKPKNPLANYTLADQARKGNVLDTQLLSVSEKPYGSPTMGKFSPENLRGYKEVLLINNQQAIAKGSRVYTVREVVADLERYAMTDPNNKNFQDSIRKLIRTIESVEGEGMIENGVHGDAVKTVSSRHSRYIETADEIWAAVEAKKITSEVAEERLATLAKAYERARIVGKVGRVLTVAAVVFTAVDLGFAGKKSYDKNSFRPIAAESVRQIGGWSGAYAGGVFGAGAGLLFGIETGPGAVLFAAGGAILFGGIGYWRGDVLAGWIDPPEETLTELRKDVNDVESMRNRIIELTVGKDETQYQFGNRALQTAAVQAQRATFKMVDKSLPSRFANKFYPVNENNDKKNDFKMEWENSSGLDKNTDGIVNPQEWEKIQGKIHKYQLNDREVDELMRMLFNISR